VSAGNVSTYTCTVTGEPAGSFSATASFGGDAQYAATSGEDNNATVALAGGTLTLGRATNASQKVSGAGWGVNGDTSVILYQCTTPSYLASSCDQASQLHVTLGTGRKAGTFRNAALHLTAGPIDSNGDTCGLTDSGACYVVAVGSSGDETASGALALATPTAKLKATTNVVPNRADKVTASDFPPGDTVIAEECDSTVVVPGTLATNCDPATKITGITSSRGKVVLSPTGVSIVDGASYTESGTGTVVPGGHADVVIDDTTTNGAFVVIPITLHT
jgi:hypothetical protein